MVARVVDIENKLQTSQSLWVKAIDSTLEIVPNRLDDTGPLERIFTVVHLRVNFQDLAFDIFAEGLIRMLAVTTGVHTISLITIYLNRHQKRLIILISDASGSQYRRAGGW